MQEHFASFCEKQPKLSLIDHQRHFLIRQQQGFGCPALALSLPEIQLQSLYLLNSRCICMSNFLLDVNVNALLIVQKPDLKRAGVVNCMSDATERGVEK